VVSSSYAFERMDPLDDLRLTDRCGALRVTVRVKPRASRSAVLGVAERALEVAVTAPPVEGAATEAVCELLAHVLDVRRRDVRVVSGAAARTKILEIDGLDLGTARARLAGAIGLGARGPR
jgi:uncharacterized protein (TIGR00251 family)